MQNILILHDYRGFFATKFEGTVEKHKGTTIDTTKLKKLFAENGFFVEVCEVSQLDYSKDYKGWYVIYASSEDAGMFYKEYIEDVLCYLKLRGAILIPDFDCFRAHNNKSYQEMMRYHFADESLRMPKARSVGHLRELDAYLPVIRYPVVLKVSNGAGSKGVVLVNSEEELKKKAKKLMKHTYRDFASTPIVRLGLLIKRGLRIVQGRRIGEETLFKRLYTNKIIIEDFIPNLSGDNKVLYFYGKYFVLSRGNRDNDFRASGSGKFRYSDNIEEIKPILELAKKAVKELSMPMLSLDIGKNAQGVYLLEFQCLYFGPYTLQYAPYCFMANDEAWVKIQGPFDLELEYARAISEHIFTTFPEI